MFSDQSPSSLAKKKFKEEQRALSIAASERRTQEWQEQAEGFGQEVQALCDEVSERSGAKFFLRTGQKSMGLHPYTGRESLGALNAQNFQVRKQISFKEAKGLAETFSAALGQGKECAGVYLFEEGLVYTPKGMYEDVCRDPALSRSPAYMVKLNEFQNQENLLGRMRKKMVSMLTSDQRASYRNSQVEPGFECE